MFTVLYKAETCGSTFAFCLNEKGSLKQLTQTREKSCVEYLIRQYAQLFPCVCGHILVRKY